MSARVPIPSISPMVSKVSWYPPLRKVAEVVLGVADVVHPRLIPGFVAGRIFADVLPEFLDEVLLPAVAHPQPEIIPPVHRIVLDHPIQIHTALFTNRIAVQPPAHFGAVVAVSVVVETGLGVLVLCAKAEGIDFGRIAGRPDGVAEGVVVVAGGDFTGLAVPKSDDVAVGVARGIVDFSA